MKSIFYKGSSLAAFIAVGTFLNGSNALGAETLEEIIVTATKRSESIQDVPISISAFSGDFIESSGINTIEDLSQFAPNLYISKSSQSVNQRVSIRGVGTVGSNALEPSVAVYIDGVYIPRPGALLGNLQDIASIEVLRGPQGTLFGRNASVGAINISTKKSTDEMQAKLGISYGSFNTYNVHGFINTPLSEQIFSRLSVSHSNTDGFGENSLPGQDDEVGFREESSLRGTISFPVGDVWEGTIRYDLQDMHTGGSPIEILPETVTSDTEAAFASLIAPAVLPDLTNGRDGKIHQIHEDDINAEQWGISTHFEGELGNGQVLRFITSYRDWDNLTLENDVFRTAAPLAGRSTHFESTQFSQEIVLLSPEGGLFDGKLDYVAGLFYSDEDYSISQAIDYRPETCVWLGMSIPSIGAACAANPLDEVFRSDFMQTSKSYAAFSQLTWHLSDSLDLTGGIRYTKDDKDATFVSVVNNPGGGLFSGVEDKQLDFSDSNVDWFANVTHFINDDIMAFATISTGYKAGGFNAQATRNGLTTDQRTYESEDVTNYELGMKTTLLGGAMQANFSVFRMEIEDFQDRSFDGFSFLVTNAAELRQQGIELDATYSPTDKLTLNANLAYLDSEFQAFDFASNLPGLPGTQDLKGKPNHFAPEHNAFLAAEWRAPIASSDLEWFARTEWTFIGESNLGATTNANPQTLQKAYDLWNLRAGVGKSDGNWEVMVYAENLADEQYCTTHYDQPAGSLFGLRGPGTTAIRCVAGTPRTLGIKADYFW